MSMAPCDRMMAVLKGRWADRVPFTIYENKLPQCALERQLRNLQEVRIIINNKDLAWLRHHRPHYCQR